MTWSTVGWPLVRDGSSSRMRSIVLSTAWCAARPSGVFQNRYALTLRPAYSSSIDFFRLASAVP
jgi:hypothetical protein